MVIALLSLAIVVTWFVGVRIGRRKEKMIKDNAVTKAIGSLLNLTDLNDIKIALHREVEIRHYLNRMRDLKLEITQKNDLHEHLYIQAQIARSTSEDFTESSTRCTVLANEMRRISKSSRRAIELFELAQDRARKLIDDIPV